MDHSKALDKIKKLLRLAASDNPHEAAAAMRQARALMEKYRLEESDIQLSEVYECAARSRFQDDPATMGSQPGWRRDPGLRLQSLVHGGHRSNGVL